MRQASACRWAVVPGRCSRRTGPQHFDTVWGAGGAPPEVLVGPEPPTGTDMLWVDTARPDRAGSTSTHGTSSAWPESRRSTASGALLAARVLFAGRLPQGPFGRVHLKGLLGSTGSTANNTLTFTLPVGYRPAERPACRSLQTHVAVPDDISPDGTVKFIDSTSATVAGIYIVLDNPQLPPTRCRSTRPSRPAFRRWSRRCRSGRWTAKRCTSRARRRRTQR